MPQELPYDVGRSVKSYNHIGKHFGKLHVLLGTDPREITAQVHTDLAMNIHSSCTHNSQQLETTQMSTNRGMDAQTKVCSHNGLLPTLKKKELLVNPQNMSGSQKSDVGQRQGGE